MAYPLFLGGAARRLQERRGSWSACRASVRHEVAVGSQGFDSPLEGQALRTDVAADVFSRVAQSGSDEDGALWCSIEALYACLDVETLDM